ncbi:hypothetical protein R3W88_004362 [Solanum pinnatisectum]|uniref:DUF7745 domain-containing protein n=1 Tax=Solanum pinnatisectum TaxID=50273 RepID=A0AAV9KB62_9SOLN|nr:hypothetical protein R3W88_004362 [Solanum pinnatisectum]
MLHLGSLTDLLNVEANKSLITLMIEFWQPTTVTFQFTDFEITPTLEEISQIAYLPLASRAPLAPRTTSGIDFLQSLGLRVGPGYDHFRGSNLLLQIRVLKHFYQRQVENDTEAGLHNKIKSHVMRSSMWDALTNEEALLKTNHVYFIELIGLEGFHPYAPLRVLRQFGITQGIPLWSNMALVEVNYKGRILIEKIVAVEEMEEDLEEDPREPTKEMEEDSEEYSEHDPKLYDPRDGGRPFPTAEDAHSEYGSIGFDEWEDSNH